MNFDPDEYQRILSEPLPNGGNAPHLTSDQLSKCTNIIDAYLQGHAGMKQYAELAVKFLHAAALEGMEISTSVPLDDLWTGLGDAPWVPPGGPRPQQDIEDE